MKQEHKERAAALAARGEQKGHIDRFDIDHGGNDALPPRRHSNPQECAPGYLWNSTTQELIHLPEDHPDYRQMRRSSPQRYAVGTEGHHDDRPANRVLPDAVLTKEQLLK